MKLDLFWWIENMYAQFRIIARGNPDITMQTDASVIGWGAVLESKETRGRWSITEAKKHINYLEMLSVYFALKSFKDKIKGKHVTVLCDNSSAVAYINNMGGCKSADCNEIAKSIWAWCIDNDVWISCTHLTGKSYVEADCLSRSFNDQLEWQLNEVVFESIVKVWGKPDIYLYASRLNNQVECYCAFKPDPYAKQSNAFLVDWGKFNCVYLFPPFSLLGSYTHKLIMDKPQAIIIIPLWPTQPWFSQIMQLLIDKPCILKRRETLLYLHHNKQHQHPLKDSLVLVASFVSGNISKNKVFLKGQPKYLCLPGKQELKNNTHRALKDGFDIVVKEKLINFNLI